MNSKKQVKLSKNKNSDKSTQPFFRVDDNVRSKDLKIGDIISFKKYNCYYTATVGKIIADKVLCHWFDINDHANETIILFEDILESKSIR